MRDKISVSLKEIDWIEFRRVDHELKSIVYGDFNTSSIYSREELRIVK